LISEPNPARFALPPTFGGDSRQSVPHSKSDPGKRHISIYGNGYRCIRISAYLEPGLGTATASLSLLCYSVRVDVRITAMHLSFRTGRATFGSPA
jgi:hypothetical protein